MGLVFHYTTSEAAANILRSHSLWFTDCEYLNDPTEIDYCYQLYRDAWENVQQGAGESDSLSYGLLVDQLNPYETYLNIDGGAISARARYYAFSTSLQGDNVGMWAAYARERDAAGCVLVFDADELGCALETLVAQNSAKGCYADTLHGRVSYDYRETFDQLVRWIRDYCICQKQVEYQGIASLDSVMLHEELRAEHWGRLSHRAPFIKSPGFAFEQEYRFVVRATEGPWTLQDGCESGVRLCFRTGFHGMVTPYLEIAIRHETFARALREVRVAGSGERSLGRAGMERLLSHLGYKKVTVVDAGIGLR
ncbi:DUF2971 domain-containing protein [Enorma massiliensis]|uniref:DUF2971 domain-containing protein n=1 Tax=Enorma massiliensis TaxID=1472761 RepID=UPI003AEFA766